MSAVEEGRVHVEASGAYDVVVGRGLLDEAGERLRAAVPGADDAVLLVTDANVGPLYAGRVGASLEAAGFSLRTAELPAGEATKCLENYGRLLSRAAQAGLTRASTVVALGGGVVGDLAGFVAATYMRGCHLVQLATSLLAMVDSSVGGKTAVDLPEGKNLAGAFHQPDLVLCDLDCLAMLPPSFVSDGMGEVVKYGVMADAELFGWLEEPLAGQEARVVERCVSLKRDVVQADEREAGRRKLLNLGHTVGHAIELLSGYGVSHGHAVAAGTAVMARACAARGWCSEGDAARVEAMLAVHGLPTGTRYAPEALARAALRDKKRVGDHIDVVAVRGVGASEVVRMGLEDFAQLVREGCAAGASAPAEDMPQAPAAGQGGADAPASEVAAEARPAPLDPRAPLGKEPVDAVVAPGGLGGCVRAISSKSAAHRMLVCAALADAPTAVRCTTTSQDIEATCACLRALGADVVRAGEELLVTPVPRDALGRAGAARARLDCGESGSTLRFLLPVVCALGAPAELDGHGRLPERPLEPLRVRLNEHGARVSAEGVWPVAVDGRLDGGAFDLPGNVSSQYVTGLLLALPLLGEGGQVRLHGAVESRPYIDMTLAALAAFGVEARETREAVCGEVDGYEVCEMCTVFTVPAGSRYISPGAVEVEGDWSNAAFWLCTGALSDTPVTVEGLNLRSVQGDRAVLDALRAFGADVRLDEARGGATVCGRDAATGQRLPLRGVELDAHDVPDLVPVLCVVASCAEGETRVVNAARLRIKESDRLQTTAELVNALGCMVEELPDALVVHGRGWVRAAGAGAPLAGCAVRSHDDHRIAMAAAVAAGAAEGPVSIARAQAVAKSYPTFFADLLALGGAVEVRPRPDGGAGAARRANLQGGC